MKANYFALALCFTLLFASPKARSGDNPPELVKAGMLRNFSLLIEWPTTAFSTQNSPLVIGILQPDPFGSEFDVVMANERVRGRPFRLQRWASVEDIGDCHLLYVPASRRSDYRKIMEHLNGKPTVIVGEDDELLKLGGLLRFVIDGRRVAFVLNAAAIKQAGVKVGAELKQAAKKIVNEK